MEIEGNEEMTISDYTGNEEEDEVDAGNTNVSCRWTSHNSNNSKLNSTYQAQPHDNLHIWRMPFYIHLYILFVKKHKSPLTESKKRKGYR